MDTPKRAECSPKCSLFVVSVNAVEATLPKKENHSASKQLTFNMSKSSSTHSLKRKDTLKESVMFHIVSYETAVSLAG